MPKGKRKPNNFKLLQREVLDLETLLCPEIEDFRSPIDNITCARHSF